MNDLNNIRMEETHVQQQFWDFVYEHDRELIDEWRKEISCPVCLEQTTGYKAVYCENDHVACCNKCKQSILRTSSDARCPVCRNDSIITVVSNNEVRILKDRIQELETALRNSRDDTDAIQSRFER